MAAGELDPGLMIWHGNQLEDLRDLLTDTGGDLRAAAEQAGVHPKSLERLVRRYRLRDG